MSHINLGTPVPTTNIAQTAPEFHYKSDVELRIEIMEAVKRKNQFEIANSSIYQRLAGRFEKIFRPHFRARKRPDCILCEKLSERGRCDAHKQICDCGLQFQVKGGLSRHLKAFTWENFWCINELRVKILDQVNVENIVRFSGGQSRIYFICGPRAPYWIYRLEKNLKKISGRELSLFAQIVQTSDFTADRLNFFLEHRKHEFFFEPKRRNRLSLSGRIDNIEKAEDDPFKMTDKQSDIKGWAQKLIAIGTDAIFFMVCYECAGWERVMDMRKFFLEQGILPPFLFFVHRDRKRPPIFMKSDIRFFFLFSNVSDFYFYSTILLTRRDCLKFRLIEDLRQFLIFTKHFYRWMPFRLASHKMTPLKSLPSFNSVISLDKAFLYFQITGPADPPFIMDFFLRMGFVFAAPLCADDHRFRKNPVGKCYFSAYTQCPHFPEKIIVLSNGIHHPVYSASIYPSLPTGFLWGTSSWKFTQQRPALCDDHIFPALKTRVQYMDY